MILKSYEIKKRGDLIKNNFFLLYGENLGLKKDIKNFITTEIKQKEDSLEIISLYENEIIDNDENFYNFIYSGSLFSSKKLITIFNCTDKLFERISGVYEKNTENVFLIIFSEVLDKKSKLRNFFEKNKNTSCVACYPATDKDLELIAQSELRKNNIVLSKEIINILIEKSNFDRNNLRNEIEKIKAYSYNKKNIQVEQIKLLINFSGDYKTDFLVNECLCGNISQYKKILSELYTSAINQILLLRILSNKIQRLLKMKEEQSKSNSLDSIINSSRPPIFWKEKPLVKKQLSIWSLGELKKIIVDINKTELLCKKNPQISNSIFFSFFSNICKKASNFS